MTNNIHKLIDIMARLRDPKDGCPWDVEQTFSSIAPHTIEEAYEVADAIERGDMDDFKDELGDLLLQVVFHAQMADEDGSFDFNAVAGAICDKLIRRHPHVFGDEIIKDAEAQTRAWETSKEQERKAKNTSDRHGVLDGVALGLPALTRALKLQNRAARVGFDWDNADDVMEKIYEELAEVRSEIDNGGSDKRLMDEIGDVLFTGVNLARKLGIDPEYALRHANGKFERRFSHIEKSLAKQNRQVSETSLDELDSLWNEAKSSEIKLE